MAVGLMCLSPARPAYAAEARLDTVRLSEASVTAVRHAPEAGRVVQVDTLDFRRQGITSVADALGRMPGVTVRDYGGAGGLKTVAVRGFSPSHTLVAYDGVALNDTRGGQVDIGRYGLGELQSVSLTTSAEFAFPQPARLAAAASVVAMQSDTVISRLRRPGLRGRLAGGSFGRVDASLRYAQRFSSRFALTASGSYYYADNDYPYTVTNGPEVYHLNRENSRMERTVADVSAFWRVAGVQSLEAKAYYYDDHRQLPGSVVLYKEGNHERQAAREAFGQAVYRRRLGTTVDLSARAKYDYRDSRYADVRDVYPDGALVQTYREREAYASVAVAWHPLRVLAMSLSADYAYTTLGSNQADEDGAYRHSAWQNLSLRWQPGRLTLAASLTAQEFANGMEAGEASRNLSRLTPSCLAEWQPWRSDVVRLRAYYKETYRPPTFTENYYYHYGSTRLLPERARQLGGGLTVRLWDGGLECSADIYRNKVRDKITAVPVNLYIWRMTNTGITDITGADAALRASRALGRRHLLALAARYTYQRVVDHTTPGTSTYGRQLAYTPVHSGGASLAYENPWVNAVLYVNAMGERYSLPSHVEGTRLAPYAEWGAALYRSFRVGAVDASVRLDVTNLFDRQYEVIARYPMPGRAFALAVEVKW